MRNPPFTLVVMTPGVKGHGISSAERRIHKCLCYSLSTLYLEYFKIIFKSRAEWQGSMQMTVF